MFAFLNFNFSRLLLKDLTKPHFNLSTQCELFSNSETWKDLKQSKFKQMKVRIKKNLDMTSFRSNIIIFKQSSTLLNKSFESTYARRETILSSSRKEKRNYIGKCFWLPSKVRKKYELTKSIRKTKFQGKLANQARM